MRDVERTGRVYLDPSVERCEPLHAHCTPRHHCARWLAAIDGAPLGDYSRSLIPWVVCPHYIAASKCTRPEAPNGTTHRHWNDGYDG